MTETIFQQHPVCAGCVWSRPTVGKKKVNHEKNDYYYSVGCTRPDDGDGSCDRLRTACTIDLKKQWEHGIHRKDVPMWRLR